MHSAPGMGPPSSVGARAPGKLTRGRYPAGTVAALTGVSIRAASQRSLQLLTVRCSCCLLLLQARCGTDGRGEQ